MRRRAPYGSWPSPITSEALVESVVRLADPLPDGEDLYWTEGRPSEGGRQVVVHRSPDGATRDVLPDGFAARTLVHEYGGLCVAVRDGTVYFTNFDDQRLYRVDRSGAPVALTPEPPGPRSVRYAAPVASPDGRFLVCVRERHLSDSVVNDLVSVATDGSGRVDVLASGHDFYGSPALSPGGDRLAWCAWDHPDMPWDSTTLYEALLADGAVPGGARVVAGGPGESVTQPRYGPDATLYFVSDRTGWWNLYAERDRGDVQALAPMEAELAAPDWVFGLASYAVLADSTVVAAWSSAGRGHLGRLERGADALAPIPVEQTAFSGIRPFAGGVVAIGASATAAAAVVEIAVPSGSTTVLRRSRPERGDAAYISVATPFEFPTAGGVSAHALVYLPRHPQLEGPAGELPPLVVSVHGGPTSQADSSLAYSVQFWTSRGFAVADVNYGGSSGYGRAYRDRLRGAWGVVDVEDCESAARALATGGIVDGERMVVHGGSAGGYTTLCATTFGDVFAAGASYYGVADAGALARDTHKFESRYLDGLIGRWPEDEARYEERSPIFHTDRMRTPLIVFQGLEDAVVPPNQAEMMVEALRARGVPVAYLAYEGEQHGFRRAENIRRTAEAELYFYGRILGFTPADDLDPVGIDNEDAIGRASRG
ncbi:MAG: prolyl oligopeptidase family serine peptidase [Actinomycetota bacterium]|nr:prolyl oligopeptidase family serine peptidase [Actinomycetota bacterium]